jgi:hypothetical protein
MSLWCNNLKQYYPQALDWFADSDTIVFCDFLTRWPTLTQVKRARKASLETFFKEHNVRFHKLIEERICSIKAVAPLKRHGRNHRASIANGGLNRSAACRVAGY